MKTKLSIIASASVASIMAFSALAQETNGSKASHADRQLGEGASSMKRMDRLNAAKASTLIGMEIKNLQGEKLGKVEDLAVDVESGRIVQVILATGGILGIGQTLHAVPPGALHHDVTNKVLHLDADAQKLAASPRFEMSKWAECCESNHVAKVYSHYGEPAWFPSSAHQDAKPTVAARNAQEARKTEGAWNKDRPMGKSVAHQSWPKPGHIRRASKLMGLSVLNRQDEKLGKVEDLMVDLPAGRIVAVILSSGGFLGMGDELSAVPPSALEFDMERDNLRLDASKQALSDAPHFKANEWPDLGEPGYVGGVYRSYKVEPYFSTNTTAEADNTGRNVRDRDERSLTPLNQGNSQSDVDITARIRKEIVGMENLSVNAQNVKIITSDGRVTLRGPIKTAEEKRLIGQIAIRAAGIENVDNQLEVK